MPGAGRAGSGSSGALPAARILSGVSGVWRQRGGSAATRLAAALGHDRTAGIDRLLPGHRGGVTALAAVDLDGQAESGWGGRDSCNDFLS
jgi:hypothetical protein